MAFLGLGAGAAGAAGTGGAIAGGAGASAAGGAATAGAAEAATAEGAVNAAMTALGSNTGNPATESFLQGLLSKVAAGNNMQGGLHLAGGLMPTQSPFQAGAAAGKVSDQLKENENMLSRVMAFLQ